MYIPSTDKINCVSTGEQPRVLPGKAFSATYLGEIPYEAAIQQQQLLMQARAEGRIQDVLLLLQHPPVFTVGRFRGEEDIIISQEILDKAGIKVIHTNRGGGITHHGPGQLVGYPILNLNGIGLGVREYIWKLEETIIQLLALFDIQGHRMEGYPGGVWADEQKICSIGINVSRHITTHGFALNVNNDLRYFEFINPCGMKGAVMTSVSKLCKRTVEIETITQELIHCFSSVFRLKCEQGCDIWQAMLGVPTG
jgi:lipoate-protein ligase B